MKYLLAVSLLALIGAPTFAHSDWEEDYAPVPLFQMQTPVMDTSPKPPVEFSQPVSLVGRVEDESYMNVKLLDGYLIIPGCKYHSEYAHPLQWQRTLDLQPVGDPILLMP